MKKQILISLLFATGLNAAMASPTSFLLTSAEVAAGRNLRNNGTQFCEVTVPSGSSNYTSVTALINLPKGARLLDTRVKSPASTQSRCIKLAFSGSTNTVQCELTRMLPSQNVTLITRYNEQIPSRESCSVSIKAGSRR